MGFVRERARETRFQIEHVFLVGRRSTRGAPEDERSNS